MAVMGDGGGDRHLSRIAEARDEGIDDAAGGAVAFDECDVADIALRFDLACAHGEGGGEGAGGGLVFHHADDAGADRGGPGGSGDGEVGRGEGLAEVDGAAGGLGPGVMRAGDGEAAVAGDGDAAGDDQFDGQRREVGGQHEVGAAAGRDGAEFAFEAEMGGGVDRGHLERHEGIAAAGDGVAQDAVHVAFADQRAGVAVVGAEDEVARVEALLRDGGDLGLDVEPGRAEAEHGAHALADAGDGVGLGGAFVVVGGAAGGIGVEGDAAVGAGIVAADGAAGLHGGRHLGQHLLGAVDNAGIIHHLAEPDDAGPGHRLGDFVGADLVAGGLEPGGGGGAGGHLGEDVDGLQHRLVMHHAHAGQPEDVGDLVGVGEHGGGAVRDHGGGEFGRGELAAFDMHVAVAEAGEEIAALGLGHLGRGADAVRGIGSDIGEAALGDGDLPAVEHLARLDVHEAAAADDPVGRGAAGGDGDKAGGAVSPGGDRVHAPFVPREGEGARALVRGAV